MQGKRILITGGTNGIGRAAAHALAMMGAEVIIVGRDEVKTRKVVHDLKSLSGNNEIDMLVGDLSSIAEIKRVAGEFLERCDRLDVLLNNVGASFSEFQTSADGYEMTFALNHISYFLLTNLLLNTIEKTANVQGEARIINVSSSAHNSARNGVDLDNHHSTKGFGNFGAYSESKLANILFTYELARRLDGSGITVNAVHPGFVRTGFGHNMSGLMAAIMKLLQRLIARTPEKGAETLVYLASSPDVAGISGKYWIDRKQVASSEISYNREQQTRLWEFSARITGSDVDNSRTNRREVKHSQQ